MTKEEYFAKGLAKVKENDHHTSIELFSKVLEIDPKDADALSQRAVAYLNLEQYELSMFDMNLAIEFDPEYSYRYQCRAYLKARLKDYEGSVEDYQKAVDLDPSDSIAYNNLALAQDQLGWANKAQANFDKSDTIAGIKTTQQRSEERKMNADIPKETEKKVSKGEITKSVFTNKNSFKEFIRFIRNGFKLNKNDKS